MEVPVNHVNWMDISPLIVDFQACKQWKAEVPGLVHTPNLDSLHLVADGVPAMQPPIQPKSTAELSNSNFSPNIPSVDLKAWI
jgi:hypothetical protein